MTGNKENASRNRWLMLAYAVTILVVVAGYLFTVWQDKVTTPKNYAEQRFNLTAFEDWDKRRSDPLVLECPASTCDGRQQIALISQAVEEIEVKYADDDEWITYREGFEYLVDRLQNSQLEMFDQSVWIRTHGLTEITKGNRIGFAAQFDSVVENRESLGKHITSDAFLIYFADAEFLDIALGAARNEKELMELRKRTLSSFPQD